MNCEQAEQLFDAYLDGELSTSLATELGAHRLRCSNCRRALALLEVSGHIIGSDREAGTLPEAFSERLLSCVSDQNRRRWVRFRKTLYIAGPMAAAAVVVLAFAGFFDGTGASKVAGVTEVKSPNATTDQSESSTLGAGADSADRDAVQALSAFIEQTRRNVEDKQRSGESLQHMLDQTILGTLDKLERVESKESGDGALPNKEPLSGADATPDGKAVSGTDAPDSGTRREEKPSGKDGVEDL
jgi:hypothetical protein